MTDDHYGGAVIGVVEIRIIPRIPHEIAVPGHVGVPETDSVSETDAISESQSHCRIPKPVGRVAKPIAITCRKTRGIVVGIVCVVILERGETGVRHRHSYIVVAGSCGIIITLAGATGWSPGSPRAATRIINVIRILRIAGRRATAYSQHCGGGHQGIYFSHDELI